MPLFFSELNPKFPGLTFSTTNFVDDSFIDKVNSYIKKQHLYKASFVGKHHHEHKNFNKVRNARINWMSDEKYKDDLMPLYEEITGRIRCVNDNHWRWVIDGWEPFQYTEYDESYKGHYDWHIDYGYKIPQNELSRKLSFSLGISEKDEYEGGELILKMSLDEQTIKLDKGEIIVFPSWMLHKVTPVTKGKRRVIVGWGLGPVV
tara:strand:- start:378 stop:989 length:612 start_codon:yes stop_codon:yes gene_type:complete